MIKKYITRQHYLDRVKPYIGKDIIKVITSMPWRAQQIMKDNGQNHYW